MIDPSVESDLQAAIAHDAKTEAGRPSLSQATATQLLSYYQGVLDVLLAAAGEPVGSLVLTGNTVACTAGAAHACTAGGALTSWWKKAGFVRHLSGRAAARYTTVAVGTARLAAGTPRADLKPVEGRAACGIVLPRCDPHEPRRSVRALRLRRSGALGEGREGQAEEKALGGLDTNVCSL